MCKYLKLLANLHSLFGIQQVFKMQWKTCFFTYLAPQKLNHGEHVDVPLRAIFMPKNVIQAGKAKNADFLWSHLFLFSMTFASKF